MLCEWVYKGDDGNDDDDDSDLNSSCLIVRGKLPIEEHIRLGTVHSTLGNRTMRFHLVHTEEMYCV